MNERELEQYLYKHIPLSLMMQVSVNNVQNDCISLRAPLTPNINHTNTVFGGSASALAILSAWSLLYVHMSNLNIVCSIVIQRNNMEYEKPIHGSFSANSYITHPELLAQFMKTLSRRGKARIEISSLIKHEDKIVGKFNGEFVVVKEKDRVK